jgi:penicillin-binding protein 1A
MLQGVMTGGTGTSAAIGGFEAGKTGTTENSGDAWFVGYNNKYTVAVWVGYPDKLKPMLTEYNGQSVTGKTFPAEIWHDFMSIAMQGEPVASFPVPSFAGHVVGPTTQVFLPTPSPTPTPTPSGHPGPSSSPTPNPSPTPSPSPSPTGSPLPSSTPTPTPTPTQIRWRR